MNGFRYRAYLAALGTAYVLKACAPHPLALAGHLRSPHAWVADVGPDAAAAALAGGLLWLIALWVACGLAATAVSLLPGRLGRLAGAIARWVTPAALRRVVITAAGTSILLSPVAAVATPGSGGAPGPPGRPGTSGTSETPSALPPIGWPTDPTPAATPARPADPAPAATPARPADPAPLPQPLGDGVTVRPGDSLWSIAADHLGAKPSAARVQAEWPRWYAANRRLIGADPNLLRPGARLQAPAADRADAGS